MWTRGWLNTAVHTMLLPHGIGHVDQGKAEYIGAHNAHSISEVPPHNRAYLVQVRQSLQHPTRHSHHAPSALRRLQLRLRQLAKPFAHVGGVVGELQVPNAFMLGHRLAHMEGKQCNEVIARLQLLPFPKYLAQNLQLDDIAVLQASKCAQGTAQALRITGHEPL